MSRARPIDRHEPGEDGLLPAEREVQEALGHLSLDFRAMRAISNLFRTSAAIRRHMEARVLGPYRLSWTSFVGLWVLWVWGEMEARGFAEAVGISRPTATGVMTTLESRGYVTRRKDASDGRMVIVLPNNVLFDTAQVDIKSKGRDGLKQVSGVLRTLGDRHLQIAGHTDTVPISTPRFPSNWELSTARAVEVTKFLIGQGLRPNVLSAAGYGEYDGVASNDTAEGRSKNRRIEITLVPTIDELAQYYIEESEKLGIRGDVAYAQSILETGGFSFGGSMVEIPDNNYAGIGACDSCSRGFIFPDARTGVRAQMQLLRVYVDPTVTKDSLPDPLLLPGTLPLGFRGKVQSWWDLTRTSATAKDYGIPVYELYMRILNEAMAAEAAAAALSGSSVWPSSWLLLVPLRFEAPENRIAQLSKRRLNKTDNPLMEPPLAISDQRRENCHVSFTTLEAEVRLCS